MNVQCGTGKQNELTGQTPLTANSNEFARNGYRGECCYSQNRLFKSPQASI